MKKASFLNQAVTYTLSNFAVAGIPFLLLPILTRNLDPAAYGLIAMFTVVTSGLSVFVGLNVHGAVMIRYFDRSHYDISEYVATGLILLIATTFVVFIFLFINSNFLTSVTGLSLFWLLISLAVALLQFIIQLSLTLWQASKQAAKYAFLRISQASFDGMLSLVLIVFLALSWQGRLSAIALTSFLFAMIGVYLLVREGWIANRTRMDYAKDALRYGVPLVPHAIGGLMLSLADRFLVTNLLDISQTGIYVVAIQVGMILGLLADSFNKAFAPWLLERLRSMDSNMQTKIVLFTYLYFVIVLLVALVGGAVSPWVLTFLVGPDFQAASSIVVYILIGNAFMGMYYMVTNYIFFAMKTELLSILTIVAGLVTITINWFLIQKNGITGAAQSFMIGQIILFAGAWILSYKCVRMPWLQAILRLRLG